MKLYRSMILQPIARQKQTNTGSRTVICAGGFFALQARLREYTGALKRIVDRNVYLENPVCDEISNLKQLLGDACACAQSVGEKREFKHMVPIRICVGMKIECERKLPSMVL